MMSDTTQYEKISIKQKKCHNNGVIKILQIQISQTNAQATLKHAMNNADSINKVEKTKAGIQT